MSLQSSGLTAYSSVIPWKTEPVKKTEEQRKIEENAREVKKLIDKGSISNANLLILRTSGELQLCPVDFSQLGQMLYSHGDGDQILSHPTITVFVGPGDIYKDVMIERLIELNPDWFDSLNIE